ncbi:FecR family protein [Flavobacteriaceae bacterium MAR_2010_72]|nr:FecR family protein [Flavobacteriaceae bacterium MAR_2010_72]TVZ58294.1 FecR family protein [Flavobacteriaceae bacterium MAR_2010_105]
MEKFNQDSTFLARWISGDLTPEELKAFKASKDYPVLNKINEASQKLESPKFDEQALFNRIKEQLKDRRPKTKVVKPFPNWAYAAAASVIIAIGLFYVLNSTSYYQTSFGEQLAVVLPDNSNVQLNANSQLEFKSRNWKSNRELNLEGEAFFDVEKGQSFKVYTDEGMVEVLGTEFNVISREDYMEVRCQEGSVRVTSSSTNDEIVLLPGDAVRIINKTREQWTYNVNEPNWLLGESTFQNTPLSQVIISLQNQFEVKFDASNVDLNSRFTGGFTHKDLNLALKTVMTPMEIRYTSGGDNTIILSNPNN